MTRKRFLTIVIFMCGVLAVFPCGLASAQISFSVKNIDSFVIPAGNLVANGDFANGFAGFVLANGSVWDKLVVVDKSAYLTGSNSLLVVDPTGQSARWVQDVVVDPTQTYRLGWVFKMEDYQGTIRLGIYLRDAFGWMDLSKATEGIDRTLLGGITIDPGYAVAYLPKAGVSKFTGTMGWTQAEIVLDLSELATLLKAAPGGITLIRLDLITSPKGPGKFWLDSMYLVPVTN